MNAGNGYPMNIGEYWAILMRRRWRFVVPFMVVIAASTALAFLLPATYRSEATILVERQTIPSDLVATTVTSYVQEQIEQIRQEIVTYDNLLNLAEKYDLYPDARLSDPKGVVQKMTDNVHVDMVDVYVARPDQKQGIATIAFTVAFSGPTPEIAQNVTKELSERYLDLHKASREKQAAEVSQFLEREANDLKAQIAQQEKALATFKQGEMQQLPELMDVNLRLHDRTEQDIDRSNESIRSLQEKIDGLQAELSLTEPYKPVQSEDGSTMLTGSQRLSALTAEYLRASSRYSAEHPDVVRLRKEISLLAQQNGNGVRADELMTELVNLQEQLRQAREKYSDSHPEVQKLQKSVAALQSGFRTALVNGESDDTPELPPDNPRYVALKTELDSTRSNLTAERKNLETLKGKLAEYEQRLFQTPAVERDYKALNRDYDNAVAKYRELKNKQMEARMAQALESGNNAEHWKLVGQAYLPKLPDSPNRLGIALLGFLVAFGAGLGGVGMSEYSDTTVRGSRMVAVTAGAPPLAVIPDLGAAHA